MDHHDAKFHPKFIASKIISTTQKLSKKLGDTRTYSYIIHNTWPLSVEWLIFLYCIAARDFTFSKQASGSRVFFAEAADCYSTVNCPRGSFSINLKGTGLRVSPSTTWVKNGTNASMEINVSHVSWRTYNKHTVRLKGARKYVQIP